ncbi:hypothetical protein BCF33_0793 [Hasllibacter halocynthiae]|uniref:DUF6456 domain-containing protein n=1 Tax=Hasllibacter halocynthiae TaxID=595589 RepID=A0A2T0X8C1_9RHOB|nr:DUF6456 domain-containing protein [Hasllibacter halocynthiae]PRY95179.1 hypothetical protein BCF33_0793 [Hasllibacter halocynthiae]
MDGTMDGGAVRAELPDWLDEGVRAYLLHVETGRPIRAIARDLGQHASTVLRQIRRFEARREDPLVDEALGALGDGRPGELDAAPEGGALALLDALDAPGAVLAVADQMDKAVIVRTDGAGRTQRTAVVERPVARALALRGWIERREDGASRRVSRYALAPAGRAVLGRPPGGMAEAPAVFEAAPRSAGAETPLRILARRRDATGRRFLDAPLTAAAERMAEDFVAAGLSVLPPEEGVARAMRLGAATPLGAALADLGDGLAEVALRTCCLGEGIERTERRLGWSARSGKIVLRIALQRLARHYGGARVAAR